MTFVVLAKTNREAIVVSDGMVTSLGVAGGGRWAQCASRLDYPKYRRVAPQLVVSCTNSVEMADGVYRHAAAHAASPGATFTGLSRFLASHLPQWHAEDAAWYADHLPQGHEYSGLPDHVKPGGSVALIGYDAEQDRMRLIVFQRGDGDYVPFEGMDCVLTGAADERDTDDALRTLHDRLDRGPWGDMPQVMAGIVRDMSQKSPYIGGQTFTHRMMRLAR